jgi:histidine ammonia-lyase
VIDNAAAATVILSGEPLAPSTIRAIARDRAPVRFGPAVAERLSSERALIDSVVSRGVPTYGVTTGLGAGVTQALSHSELASFSVRTVRGRANAVGPPLPLDAVRAAMAARLNSFAHGGSGVQPAVAFLLLDMLNAGVHPLVPGTGSVGASDLCLLAHVAQVVMGEGFAEFSGSVSAGDSALALAGLRPAVLGPKDGLALCSSNSVSTGIGALALADGDEIFDVAQAVAALTYEGFRANTTPLDPRVQAARPAPGQLVAANGLRALLAGSLLLDPANARRLQDPISLRCVSQVHGALSAALDFVRPALAAELGGAADNPLVLASEGRVVSTGNFHTAALALAFDTLALALCHVATLSVARTECLLTGRHSGLPVTLSPRGPGHTGFMALIKTSQALAVEIKQLATPVSTDTYSSADGVEDDTTNALLAARRTGWIIDRLRSVLAVEALVAAQAVDLADVGALGAGPALLHRSIRAIIEPLDDDRACGPDVERVAAEVLADRRVLAELAGFVAGSSAASAPSGPRVTERD